METIIEKNWTVEGIGPRQLKKIDDIFFEVKKEHKTYIQLTRFYDGVSFYENQAIITDVSGVPGIRTDLTEKLNLLKESYQGKINQNNLKEIEQKLTQILEWARSTRPIKDERKSEEELLRILKESEEKRKEEKRKKEEFMAKSVPIPPGKRGVMLDICFDGSNIATDYFDKHCLIESHLLAIISLDKEEEIYLRNVINRIPVLKNITWEWRAKKYSMGHGNFLVSRNYSEKKEYQGKEVNCHYRITFATKRAIPHPDFYLGEITNGNGKHFA